MSGGADRAVLSYLHLRFCHPLKITAIACCFGPTLIEHRPAALRVLQLADAQCCGLEWLIYADDHRPTNSGSLISSIRCATPSALAGADLEVGESEIVRISVR